MGLFDQLQAYIQANTPRNTRPAVSPATVIDNGLLGGRIAQVPQRAQEAYQGLLNAPKEVAQLFDPKWGKSLKQQMDNPQAANPQQWIDAGMELSGLAPLGGIAAHTVYHGSPHKFDKFDMSKIGTGEGAQAYGHGLYFAENPKVAQSYKEALSDTTPVINGRPRNFDDDNEFAASVLLQSKNNPDAAISFLKTQLQHVKKGSDSERKLLTTIEIIGSGKQLPKADYSGAFYKVDIPDEAIPRMLDWDKRMYEQNPDVLQKMPGLADGGKRYNQISQEMDALMWQGKLDSPEWDALKNEATLIRETLGYAPNDTGEELIRKLGGNVKAAEYLKQQGIPGIRYLDGSSRTAGEGTSNYVLFDDQMPRILEVNGQPTGLLSYADEAKKAKAGLLDDGVGGAKIGEMKNTNQAWAQTDVFGSGSRIDHVSQDGKSAVVQQMTRPGVYRYYPANVHEQFGVQPNMSKGFDSLEEAQRNIKGMRISDTRKANSQAKYGEIPNLWDGEAKRMAKALIDNNIPIAKFSSSTQSKSKYIELADGRKIRLSDHDLPLSYEMADVDYRYGGNVKDIIKKLK